jgi:hypothetical protein
LLARAGFSESVRVQRSPALLFDPASPGERVTAMSSGADHVLLLTADGVVLSFGCAEKGRLGRLRAADADAAIGDVTSATERAALMRIVTTPTAVPGLPQIASIAAVRGHARTRGHACRHLQQRLTSACAAPARARASSAALPSAPPAKCFHGA